MPDHFRILIVAAAAPVLVVLGLLVFSVGHAKPHLVVPSAPLAVEK
jgi:hypothetical protein